MSDAARPSLGRGCSPTAESITNATAQRQPVVSVECARCGHVQPLLPDWLDEALACGFEHPGERVPTADHRHPSQCA